MRFEGTERTEEMELRATEQRNEEEEGEIKFKLTEG